MKTTLKNIQPHQWLGIFILLHVILWTITPFLVRFTLPMDAMEGTIWGQHFEWGYDKNPFLNGWLTAIALKIGGNSGWAIYLFSQLSVASCFWAVWQLGKKILPASYALIAVLLLEGAQYYNIHSIDFDDNTLELALWSLTVLAFYQALSKNSGCNWIATGIAAGLGMMAKYYTAILLLPMALLLIKEPRYRQTLKTLPPYLGLIAFILVITPHTIWLFFHNFVTVNYALDRVDSLPSWSNHLYYPGLFAWQQITTFMPVIVLLCLLLIGKKPFLMINRIHISRLDKQFLLYVGLGPFLITVLLSAATGMQLRAGWGTPLLSLWGIILLAWLQPHITPSRFYRFLTLFFILFITLVTTYAYRLSHPTAPSSANYPGKQIAEQLTAEWHQTYHQPLHYVAGSRWTAGNIAFHSGDKPWVYINWNPLFSPSIDEEKLKSQGAIFIWDTKDHHTPTPETVYARFPNLTPLRTLHFDWLRNSHFTPIEIKVAFLPPASAK